MSGRGRPKNLEGKALLVSVIAKDVSYYAILDEFESEGKREHWLQGYAMADQSWVSVSVFFKDIAMKQWAIDTLLSTKLPDGEPNPAIIFQ